MALHWKMFLLMFGFAGISLLLLQSLAPSLVVVQAVSFGIGIVTFTISRSVSFDFWKSVAKLLYVVLIVLLLSTYVIGKSTKGSTRWLSFGFGQFQPSQVAKPILALALAVLASLWKTKKTARDLGTFFVLAGLPIGLVFFQPDLGTAIVLASLVLCILLQLHLSRRFFVGFTGIGVLIAIVAWVFVLKPYQKERLYSLINPANNLSTSGYNAFQAQIAVGSGKLLGRGLGQGVQSELRFLPERQTDFFFASLSEELGFVGASVVLIMYLLLLYFMFQSITQMKDVAGILYSFGVVGIFCTQIIINIGMNIGVLPITGITLPFLSYGGSSIISLSLALGILMSAVKTSHKDALVEIRSFL